MQKNKTPFLLSNKHLEYYKLTNVSCIKTILLACTVIHIFSFPELPPATQLSTGNTANGNTVSDEDWPQRWFSKYTHRPGMLASSIHLLNMQILGYQLRFFEFFI